MTCSGPSSFEAVSKVVVERRSIRAYSSKMPPKEVIEKVLEVARWSPSGGNVQDWRFVVVTDAKLLRALRAFSPGWIASGNPAAIVICSDRKSTDKMGPLMHELRLIHVGIVAQTISLVAHSMGLGTCMIGSFSKPAVKKLLNLPDHWDPLLIMLIGYPERTPPPPPRLSLEEITMWR